MYNNLTSLLVLYLVNNPLIIPVVYLVGLLFVFLPLIFIFKKAGRVWWYALIPIANIFILVEIAGLPKWFGFFTFLYFFQLPFTNILLMVWSWVLFYFLSKRFGCNNFYTLGLMFLPFIFEPIIAFGKSEYIPPEKQIINQPPASQQVSQSVVAQSESAQIPQPPQTV